jgi:hypothetical protein
MPRGKLGAADRATVQTCHKSQAREVRDKINFNPVVPKNHHEMKSNWRGFARQRGHVDAEDISGVTRYNAIDAWGTVR